MYGYQVVQTVFKVLLWISADFLPQYISDLVTLEYHIVDDCECFVV